MSVFTHFQFFLISHTSQALILSDLDGFIAYTSQALILSDLDGF